MTTADELKYCCLEFLYFTFSDCFFLVFQTFRLAFANFLKTPLFTVRHVFSPNHNLMIRCSENYTFIGARINFTKLWVAESPRENKSQHSCQNNFSFQQQLLLVSSRSLWLWILVIIESYGLNTQPKKYLTYKYLTWYSCKLLKQALP